MDHLLWWGWDREKKKMIRTSVYYGAYKQVLNWLLFSSGNGAMSYSLSPKCRGTVWKTTGKTPPTCMESRSFFNIKRQLYCSNVAGSAAVTHAYTRARARAHIQEYTWLAPHLKVIEIPFTPPLLSLWESNMKWFNSVIKTGNEIRACD